MYKTLLVMMCVVDSVQNTVGDGVFVCVTVCRTLLVIVCVTVNRTLPVLVCVVENVQFE